MLHSSVSAHSQTIGTSVYRPRRPARSVLHKTVRHHLETWLAGHDHTEGFSGEVPAYVEAAFRAYLKCGILARLGAVAFLHRFGSFLNSHVHYHVLVTDGVFSPTDNDDATFHAAVDFTQQDIVDLRSRMRARGLRFLERHGHLDRTAIDSLDAAEHAGGWSVDASVHIAP